MNEITVHLGNGHPIDIHIDGAAPVAINAFVLLTSVPVTPPASHYGPWPRTPSRQGGGGQVSLIVAFHHHGFPAGGADEFIFRDESLGCVDHPLRRSHRIARATLGAGVIVAHFLLHFGVINTHAIKVFMAWPP